jgi:NAD(P)-dependent dehydrogenase (short-subunit alcohol dehydrogenase family)
LALRADVADLAEGRALLDRVLSDFGRVDLWVNNAGVAPAARLDLLETTPESWDRVLGINLRGPFFLTQAVGKAMLDLITAGTVLHPQIIFVTSVSSTFASVNRADYCVSKAGLSMAVQLFATRLAEQGILVYEVRPGIIATDMTGPVREDYERRIRAGLSPIRRWGEPADVGRAVAALASGALPFSTGEVIHVDGGLHLRRL